MPDSNLVPPIGPNGDTMFLAYVFLEVYKLNFELE